MLEVAVAAAAVPFGIPPPPPIVKQEEGEEEVWHVLNFELADRAKAALMVNLNKGLEITAGERRDCKLWMVFISLPHTSHPMP